MKKTLIHVVSIVLFLFLLVAASSNPTGVEVGSQAPNIEISNANSKMSLQQARGKYVIVTFWSSVDAQSRLANRAHDRAAKANSHLQHLAVNFDKSKSVWSEILKLDELSSNSQFYGVGKTGDSLLESWKQEDGFTSYLIDPQGVIVAVNPSEEMLYKI